MNSDCLERQNSVRRPLGRQAELNDLDVLSQEELVALREVLAKDPLWQLGNTWELKAKVHSDYEEDLPFGFPGGDGAVAA